MALDPHTGQVKALVGGRNYGLSQLDRALAKRQPGSIFKPFVYATALDTAVEGGSRIMTAATTVVDQPTTFWYDNKPYEPNNFKGEFYGTVYAAAGAGALLERGHRQSGGNGGLRQGGGPGPARGPQLRYQPTPAVALGSYDVTPLEMAGAYTVFSDGGTYIKPNYISMVRAQDGKAIYVNNTQKHQALDPRVAYLMTNLMEEVMRSGTAAGVRARGFAAPAAGKTGTSRDGWFAGYTSELLCIVWVGFDDNRELNLEGAHSALPIWTEFMKRALQLPPLPQRHAFPGAGGDRDGTD